jgi:hypothetical protein
MIKNRAGKIQVALASLEELAMAGTKITIVASRKAPKQKMRCKGSKGFVVGGARPGSVVAQSIGV